MPDYNAQMDRRFGLRAQTTPVTLYDQRAHTFLGIITLRDRIKLVPSRLRLLLQAVICRV